MAGELRGRNIGQAMYKKIANSVVFIVQRINIYIYMCIEIVIRAPDPMIRIICPEIRSRALSSELNLNLVGVV